MSTHILAPKRGTRPSLLITIYRGRELASPLFPLYLAGTLLGFHDEAVTRPPCFDLARLLWAGMTRLIRFNKPFDVLPQFTDRGGHGNPRRTLSDFVDLPSVYPAGRLDRDSEGLMLLTDDGPLQARISDPKHKMAKTYWVQVEGSPDAAALNALAQGVELKDGLTKPAQARIMDEPAALWPRTPPIRVRKNIPDTWVELTLREGRNRQVRRMTAAVGHPTLRLIRWRIGDWTLEGLLPGIWQDAPVPGNNRRSRG